MSLMSLMSLYQVITDTLHFDVIPIFIQDRAEAAVSFVSVFHIQQMSTVRDAASQTVCAARLKQEVD